MLHLVDLAKLFLLRHATPYHAPLYLAQARGYFRDEGLKAMIHTLAVRTPYAEITNISY